VADPLNVEDRQEASNNNDIIPDGAPVVSGPDFANSGREHLDWNDLDRAIPFIGLVVIFNSSLATFNLPNS
jgi:hypothetical protein